MGRARRQGKQLLVPPLSATAGASAKETNVTVNRSRNTIIIVVEVGENGLVYFENVAQYWRLVGLSNARGSVCEASVSNWLQMARESSSKTKRLELTETKTDQIFL